VWYGKNCRLRRYQSMGGLNKKKENPMTMRRQQKIPWSCKFQQSQAPVDQVLRSEVKIVRWRPPEMQGKRENIQCYPRRVPGWQSNKNF
jgi:hypothetical protein